MIVLADVTLLAIEDVIQFLLIVLLFVQLISFMDDIVMVVQFLNFKLKAKNSYEKSVGVDIAVKQSYIISIFQYNIGAMRRTSTG